MDIILDGNAGSAKTWMATFIAVTSDVEIISNYELTIPFTPLDLNLLFEENENPRLFLVDEAQSLIDCRNSMSTFNKIFSYANAQRRKTNTVICLTVPDFYMLEGRIREACDVLIHCERINDEFHFTVTNFRTEKEHSFAFPLAEMECVFKYYKTHELVLNSDEINDIRSYNFKSNKDTFNSEISDGVTKVLDYCKEHKMDVTKDRVKFILTISEDCFNDTTFCNNVYIVAKEKQTIEKQLEKVKKELEKETCN